MNTDHIVHNIFTNRMECQHCGFSEALKMPATIDDIVGKMDAFTEAHRGWAVVDKMDAFTEAHRGCTAPQSETVMSEYIAGFDAGYSFVLHEIEQYIKRHDYEPRITGPLLNLLANLKASDKPNIRESP